MKKTTLFALITLFAITFSATASAQAQPTLFDSSSTPLTGDHITTNLTHTAFDSLIITFPKGWETRITTVRTEDYGDSGQVQSTNFGFAGKGELLSITKHTQEQWQKLLSEAETTPTYLAQNDTHVYAYKINQESEAEQKAIIPWIISNIKLQKNSLSDISDHTANKAIRYLLTKNIINGYDDGSYKPENQINRAELIKIIVTSKGQNPIVDDYSDCFNDITTEWYAPYICYAKNQSWIKGYDDGTFKPAQAVNKAEAIKMIVNAHEFTPPETVTKAPFSDVDPSAWFAPFVKSAQINGLIAPANLTEENYGIAENITRGEIAENIYRAMLVNTVAQAKNFDPSTATPLASDPSDKALDSPETSAFTPTLENHFVFLSEPFKFSIEYPRKYFYGTVESEDDNIIRRYEFGTAPLDEEPGLLSLELRNGEAPNDTILTLNEKELVLSYTETEINIYFTDSNNRLYRLSGPIENEEEVQNMASTIEIYETLPEPEPENEEAPEPEEQEETASTLDLGTEPTI